MQASGGALGYQPDFPAESSSHYPVWTGGMASSKKPLPLWAQVAQSVEQRIENPRVGSSILSLGTIILQQDQFLAS